MVPWLLGPSFEFTVIKTIILGLLVVVISLLLRKKREWEEKNTHRTTTKQQQRAEHSACKNPNCVRCQRYRHVQERAKTRIPWILRDLQAKHDDAAFLSSNSRIQTAVQQTSRNDNRDRPWQQPTVLMVPNLPSKEVVTESHPVTCEYLRQNNPTRQIILRALNTLSNNNKNAPSSLSWTFNDSPQGRWEVLQILNQGTWNPLLLEESQRNEAWREVLDLVRNIPELMDGCLFGNAMVSRIYPGTLIEPHCGPTNVRHRLQFVLEMPIILESKSANPPGCKNDSLSLFVGENQRISWDEVDDVFVFDDSFIHSVTYPKSIQNRVGDTPKQLKRPLPRTVLIVDLWHPDLQEIERTLLQHLYPPFPSAATKSF